MLTTRAIAASRAASEAVRRADGAAAQDAAGGSFVAVLGGAGVTADRPPAAGAAPPPDDRDPDPDTAASSSLAGVHAHGSERPRQPLAAVARDSAAAPATADDKSKSKPSVNDPATGPAARQTDNQSPRHRLPPALAAMLLAVPPLQAPILLHSGGSGASALQPQTKDPAGAAGDSGTSVPWPAGISSRTAESAQRASGATVAPRRDAVAQVAPPDAIAQAASPDGGSGTLLPAVAADATGLGHRSLSANFGQASHERVPALGPAPQGVATIGVAVQPIAASIGRGALERPAARIEEGGAGAAVAAALSGAGEAAAPTGSITTPASPPDGGAAGLVQQVAGRLAGALAAGRLEVVLRLHPPELGELNVRLQVNGREVSAWFDSPLPHVQQVLSQGMVQLHAGLATAGYNLNGAWIGGDAWTPRGWAGQPAPRPARGMLGRPAASSPGAPSPTAGSGVSLYV